MPIPTQEVHVWIPRMYEYVTLHGKRDFADVIKSKHLELGKVAPVSWGVGPNLNTWSERDMTMEEGWERDLTLLAFEGGGRWPQAKECGCAPDAEKSKEAYAPLDSPKKILVLLTLL